MSAHSPGEWQPMVWRENATNHQWNVIAMPGRRMLARVDGQDAEANARLMARAPDLLRERDELLAIVNRRLDGGACCDWRNGERITCNNCKADRALVARIEGSK